MRRKGKGMKGKKETQKIVKEMKMGRLKKEQLAEFQATHLSCTYLYLISFFLYLCLHGQSLKDGLVLDGLDIVHSQTHQEVHDEDGHEHQEGHKHNVGDLRVLEKETREQASQT